MSEDPATLLQRLENHRDDMVFIGGNYAKNRNEIYAVREALEDIDRTPIVVDEIFSSIDPDTIHENSLRTLHNCQYAVIEVSNPAGQLMELERARDYGIPTYAALGSQYPSAMVETLMDRMAGWDLGYLFTYEREQALKNFISSIFTINHPSKISDPVETISQAVDTSNLTIITSIGALNATKRREQIADLLSPVDTIVMTGWDYQTRGENIATDYDADMLVCEGSLLYERKNDDFIKQPSLGKSNSADRRVRMINRYVIEEAHSWTDDSIVFYSQGNERSIAFYLNPPDDIREQLDQYQKQDNSISDVQQVIIDRVGREPNNVDGEKLFYRRVEDQRAEEDLLFAIEKANASKRTFQPYAIGLTEDHILLDLDPETGDKSFSYHDVQGIVEKVRQRMVEDEERDQEDITHLKNRVAAQRDVAIDIFYKAKDEIINPVLERKADDHDETFVYLSKGTESDIPLIFKGYASNYDFVAVGTNDISQRLQQAGVLSLNSTYSGVIEDIREIFE